MEFKDYKLNKQLQNALAEMNITTPTPIQEKTLPVILAGKDVVGIAQTGTGKTLAFLLPVIRDLKYSEQKTPRVLILVPTRELVVQVCEEIEKLTQYISVRTLGVYGGTNINTQKQLIHEGCDILVATPGRLFDLAMTGILRFKTIQKLIIDECDEMLDLGFRPQLKSIIELLPPKRQNLLFSATLVEEVEDLINAYFRNPEKIEAASSGTPLENIDQQFVSVKNFYTKINYLKMLLADKETYKKILIFTANKRLADLVSDELEIDFPEEFGTIHSNKSQNYRLRMVQEFKTGDLRGIVATDLVSRGLDIDKVTHVINMDVPEVPENYMHRIGRTGRAEANGHALTLVTEKEEVFKHHIEGLMKMEVPLDPMPEEVTVSSELILEEEPAALHQPLKVKIVKREAGPAFHEKKEKNKKENWGNSKKNKKLAKYKKPKKKRRN